MSRLPQTPHDTVLVSGGFDPAHIGHIRMILEAAQYGNVIVVANSDAWLMRKKGYIFMPWEERAELLSAIRGVTSVERVADTDGTVCEAIKRLKPTYFANGGDRKTGNTPEMNVCKELGVQLLWNVGGGKIQSSSNLVEASGMVMATESDDPDLPRPSSVEVITSRKP
jgi:D-beta-D-heptose 7-phosphate kinase/D-beta-D-heptose 1-phosphate adenosyltransferase